MRYCVRGFTLIELSIVLVIIGLIVGGILVGQDLIKAAAVRAQVTQIERYNTAANTFRGKYGYLPGDIKDPEATQFGFQPRGSLPGQGDGNGLIQSDTRNTPNNDNIGVYMLSNEEAMFWVDLTVAHLIDGSFTAATPTMENTSIAGAAVGQYLPAAKIGNGGGYVAVWCGGWKEVYTGNAGEGDGSNYFALATLTGNSPNQSVWNTPLMTPAQAYAIDNKMDDGLPQRGNVIAIGTSNGWSAGGPLTGSPQRLTTSGDYDLTTGGPVVAGDGEATKGPNQGITTTCYDNNNMPGATETYSVGDGNMVNCVLSFRFQ